MVLTLWQHTRMAGCAVLCVALPLARAKSRQTSGGELRLV